MRGLPFAANYHVSPATVLEAVRAYRAAFRPSDVLAAPKVMVSVDVASPTTTRQPGPGLALRPVGAQHPGGRGAIPSPAPTGPEHEWTDEDRALVADRISTQFTGSPQTVAEKLRVLRRVTGADEL